MVSSRQPAGTNTPEPVEVVPLTLHVGAEIRGVDLTQPLSREQLKTVRDAFLKWKEDLRDDYPGKGKALFQVSFFVACTEMVMIFHTDLFPSLRSTNGFCGWNKLTMTRKTAMNRSKLKIAYNLFQTSVSC